jgi:cytochrome c biogenesis protein CcmG/thiol:disulfide interchange protein DsbE
MRYALPVVLLAVLLVLLAIGLRLDPREVPSPLIGKPVPAFSLPILDQDATLSQEQLRGRVTLVNFWASWCAGCRIEHPFLMRLARESGVEIIGMDYKDDPDAARATLARHGNPYRTVAIDRNGAAGLDWGVYGVPETYVVGADGTILYKQIGPLTDKDWAEHVRPHLSARSEE